MTLQDYYVSLGFDTDAWHVGPEHPALEELGLAILATTRGRRILEIGVQAGGFAVPVILAAADQPGFAYTGADNLAYTNAVPLQVVADYLALQGVRRNIRMVEDDASVVLDAAPPGSFDLILLDHYKPKYAVDLLRVFERELLADGGAIILHDVLGAAATEWPHCARACSAFGYVWTIERQVPQGAAVIRRDGQPSRSGLQAAVVPLAIRARWCAHAGVLRCRRLVGRALRAVGHRPAPPARRADRGRPARRHGPIVPGGSGPPAAGGRRGGG